MFFPLNPKREFWTTSMRANHSSFCGTRAIAFKSVATLATLPWAIEGVTNKGFAHRDLGGWRLIGNGPRWGNEFAQ